MGFEFIGPAAPTVEVKTKRQNFFLIFENDHSKLRILVCSRLENQRICLLVVTATIHYLFCIIKIVSIKSEKTC